MDRLSKILPLALLPLLAGLCGCAETIRVTKVDLQRNSYEITPIIGWAGTKGSDEDLKQAIRQAASGLCGAAGVEVLDVERPAYILVPMPPRGYLYCR